MRSGILKSFGKVFAVASAAVLMTSCFKDVDIEPNNGGTTDKKGETTFMIDVPAAAIPQTRGIEEGGEADNKIHDLVFLLFDPETHEYIEMVAATNITDTEQINRKKATVPNLPDGEYLALVVANYLKCLILNEDMSHVTNYEQALQHFSQSMRFAFNNGDLDDFINTGEFSGPTMFDQVDNEFFMMGGYYDIPENRSTLKSVFLKRSLAKINVIGTAVEEEFVISEIRVVNGNMVDEPYVCDILPAMLEDGETVSMFNPDHLNPVVRSRTTDCLASALVYGSANIDAETNSCIDEIFLPEVAVPEGIDEDDLRNSENDAWKDAVAVLIKAKIPLYDDDRWFRVNLRMPDADNGDKLRHVNIVRNYSYTINITKAEGHGYATADEAYNALPGDLVVYMTVLDDGSGLDNIVYNGQYYLASNNLETFESWESVQPNGYKLHQQLKLYTNYPGGWQIESVKYDDVSPDATIEDNAWFVDENVLVSTVDNQSVAGTESVPVKVNTNHGPAVRRTANIIVTAGPLRLEVLVTQKPGGILASPGVLGTGVESGELTLQGSREYSADNNISYHNEFEKLSTETVYITYFQWGSLIGLSSANNNDGVFTSEDIVWSPKEYNIDALCRDIDEFTGSAQDKFRRIPVAKNTYMPPNGPANAALGLGDPCKYADGEMFDDWKMPIGGFHVGGWDKGTFGNSASREDNDEYLPRPSGTGFQNATSSLPAGIWAKNKSMYLPVSGVRMGNGTLSMSSSIYWSSTVEKGFYGLSGDDGIYGLNFTKDGTGVKPSFLINPEVGLAVRCVREPMIHASPGVIGLDVVTGKLTLRGSRAYRDNENIRRAAEQMFPNGDEDYSEPGLSPNDVYIVYFKWGSTVAIRSVFIPKYDKFDMEDIVRADGYGGHNDPIQALIAAKGDIGDDWKKVPYVDDGPQEEQYIQRWPDTTPENTARGIGDACELYFGSSWYTPYGGDDSGWNSGIPFGKGEFDWNDYPNKQIPNGAMWITHDDFNKLPHDGAVAGNSYINQTDWSMFLPLSLTGRDNQGYVSSITTISGRYWSRTATVNHRVSSGQSLWTSAGTELILTNRYVDTSGGSDLAVANAIRCIKASDVR